MNKHEAKALLARELEGWRQQSYADLVHLVDDEPKTGEVRGDKGVRYQYKIQVVWDAHPGEDIRVLGAIDDGGFRAFFPVMDGFIIAPDGGFVGEDSV